MAVGSTAADSIATPARAGAVEPIPTKRLRNGERAFLLDTAMVVVALAADYLAARQADLPIQSIGWLVLPALLTLAVLAGWGVYRPRMTSTFLEDLRSVIAATAVAAMTVTFLRVLTMDDRTAASQAVRFWLFAGTYLVAARVGVRISEVRAAARGSFGSPTLIVGAGRVGRLIAKRLMDKPEVGLARSPSSTTTRSEADFDADEVSQQPDFRSSTRRSGSIVDRHRPRDHRVLLLFARAGLDLARRLHDLGVTVSIVPRLFEAMPDRVPLERTVGLPLVTIFP